MNGGRVLPGVQRGTWPPNRRKEFKYVNGNLKLRSILILCVLALLTAMLSAVHPLAAEANAFSLTLNVSPPGSGTATANPGPPYSQNQTVTLTATANPGYVFDHWVSSADAKWWDAGWDYRVEVTAAAAGYARKNKPAEFDVNFTQLWTSLGTSGTLDPNSIRVVEVDGDDNVIDADVPFQFDKATDYNAATKAAGKVVVIMVGNTGAGAKEAAAALADSVAAAPDHPTAAEQLARYLESAGDAKSAASAFVTAARAASSRPHTSTSLPSCTSASARARPMPRVPPVTTATLAMSNHSPRWNCRSWKEAADVMRRPPDAVSARPSSRRPCRRRCTAWRGPSWRRAWPFRSAA